MPSVRSFVSENRYRAPASNSPKQTLNLMTPKIKTFPLILNLSKDEHPLVIAWRAAMSNREIPRGLFLGIV